MYDSNNLDDEYCCTTEAEYDWVEGFQTSTLALFAQMKKNTRRHNVIYSSACLVHCLSSNADFWQFTVEDRIAYQTEKVSLMRAAKSW